MFKFYSKKFSDLLIDDTDNSSGQVDTPEVDRRHDSSQKTGAEHVVLPMSSIDSEKRSSVKNTVIVLLSIACLLLFLLAITGWSYNGTKQLKTQALKHESGTTAEKQSPSAEITNFDSTSSASYHESAQSSITIPETTSETTALTSNDTKCGRDIPVEIKAVCSNADTNNATSYIMVNGQVISSAESKGIYLVFYMPDDHYFENGIRKESMANDTTELNIYLSTLAQAPLVLGMMINLQPSDVHAIDSTLRYLGIADISISSVSSLNFISKTGFGLIEENIANSLTSPAVLSERLATLPCGCNFVNNNNIVNGRLILSLNNELSNDGIHIYGSTTNNPQRMSFNLWSEDKNQIDVHYDVRWFYSDEMFNNDVIVMNTNTYTDPNNFPGGSDSGWGSEKRTKGVPIKGGSVFHIQIKIAISGEFIIKIDDCHEDRLDNRLGLKMNQIKWLVIRSQDETIDYNHFCMW